VISVAVIIAVGHLRYHEVDELRAGVRRNVKDRRLRVANNIRVRRAALALSKASDLDEMFEATRHLLDFGEFSFANAEVGQAGRRVFWSWSGKGEETNGNHRPRTEWSFRLPLVKDGIEWGWVNLYRSFDREPLLVDTNYLSDLFRREFTDAAVRILTSQEMSEPVRQELQDLAVRNA
jgi:hypothetical protein